MSEGISELLRYYLGPTGIPDRIAAANYVLNPVAMAERAGTASREMLAPDRTAGQRTKAGLDMLLEMTGMVPGAALAKVLGAPARAVRVAGTVDEVPVPAQIPEELLEYNVKARTPAGLLDRDTVLAGDNVLYRPDRAYRFIGGPGYEDFLASGQIRAKPGSKQGYEVPYFMKGKTSSRYARGGGGDYLVEAIPSPQTWRGAAQSFDVDKYVGPSRSLTLEDAIRIFQRQDDGSYKVILDKIGDEALLPSLPARADPVKKFAAGGPVRGSSLDVNIFGRF